jgi:hypothetical protein
MPLTTLFSAHEGANSPLTKQFHCTSVYRDILNSIPSPMPVLDYDACAEIWVRDLETMQQMAADPEYLGKIAADEEEFIDKSTLRILLGVDYVVIEDGKAVEEHQQDF